MLYQSGYRVSKDDRFVLNGDQSLTITNINEDDLDKYKCNIYTPESVFITYDVRTSDLKATILIGDRDVNDRSMTFKQGERIELLCKANGPSASNAINYIWSSDGARLTSNDQFEIDGGRLVIESANKNHNRVYQCLADDGNDGAVHASVTIKMQCTFIQTIYLLILFVFKKLLSLDIFSCLTLVISL